MLCVAWYGCYHPAKTVQRSAMDDLQKLRHLSLVSRVCTELDNHLGIKDKTLAEFLIDLARKHSTLDSFRDAVTQASGGDPLPEPLTASVYRSIPQTPKDAANSAKRPRSSRPFTSNLPVSCASDGFLGSGIDTSTVLRASDVEHRALVSLQNRNDRKRLDSSDKIQPKLTINRAGRNPIRNPSTSDLSPGAVIEGFVANVRDFGAFISFTDRGNRTHERSNQRGLEGLVHKSQFPSRVTHPAEYVKRGQRVFVKVLTNDIDRGRISLTMRGIDQTTGSDNTDQAYEDSSTQVEDYHHNRERRPPRADSSVSGIPEAFRQDASGRSGRLKRRLPETEQWELTQLSKILPQKELTKHLGATLNDHLVEEENEEDKITKTRDATLESMGVVLRGNDGDDTVEDTEIELNEDEPAFLQSSTVGPGASRVQPLSPVRIVKNPDGSMQRAALTQAALLKERREERDQQRAALEAEVPSDLNVAWEDPMSSSQRQLAAALRGSAAGPSSVPEWKKSSMGAAPQFGYAKPADQTIAQQREALPIYGLRSQLLGAINQNQVLIVVGETGSGKSTQMTQYLLEAGYTKGGKRVGCTQPRRVAAMSVAKRVAEERGTRLGEEVGYSVRFDDCTSQDTRIKYMTDGMLLREVLTDRNLRQYSVIMLDEAHERTIATDVLFGLLKDCVKKRPDLKVIVTSATLDAEKFSAYFFNCDIFTIPGRLFPVEVFFAKEPVFDYMEESLNTVMRIHFTEPAGDILLFLTGQEEIDTAAEVLYERMKKLGKKVPQLIILPVYSALPSEMQTRIFDPAPPGARKVVIATNIAEASLTIDGIYYVVDPGFAKQKVYNPKLGMDSLVVAPISQASSRQRKGRAGRTGPGKCFCLYTETAFMNEMLPTTVPELQRSNLSHTVLTLKAMGIDDLLTFDFMDRPPTPYLISAMERLYSLGALDEEGLLTRLGRMMSQFPLDPMLSKMLLASVDLGCSDDVLTVVSMLGVQGVFYRPKEKQGVADQKKSKFHQPEGDHLTLLTVYNLWVRNRCSSTWAYDNFIQTRSLKRAQDVRKQLVMIMDRFNLDIISAGANYVKIRKAIVSGFYVHAAKKDPQEGYRTLVDGQQVFIHPSSSLFHTQPEWVIYHEVVLTTKEYMREVMAIESKWLVELAPRFFRTGDPTKLSRRKKREKIEPLFDKYAQNPDEWRLSRRRRI